MGNAWDGTEAIHQCQYHAEYVVGYDACMLAAHMATAAPQSFRIQGLTSFMDGTRGLSCGMSGLSWHMALGISLQMMFVDVA